MAKTGFFTEANARAAREGQAVYAEDAKGGWLQILPIRGRRTGQVVKFLVSYVREPRRAVGEGEAPLTTG